MPLYLIFLAVIFYMPRCFWLMMEGGLMKFFGKGTTTRFIEDQDEKREKLVQFFCRNIHNKYCKPISIITHLSYTVSFQI